MRVRCPDCGFEASPDWAFCQRCGYSFRGGEAIRPPRRKDSTFTIAAVVAVAAVIVLLLSAALVNYIGGSYDAPPDFTPAAAYSKTRVDGGMKITVVSITRSISWDDVKVMITDDTYFAVWSPDGSDLDDGSATTATYSPSLLGPLRLSLSVLDLAGNGVVSGSDSFTIIADPAFASEVTYSARLIYEPTGEGIGTGITFTG